MGKLKISTYFTLYLYCVQYIVSFIYTTHPRNVSSDCETNHYSMYHDIVRT